MSNGQVFGFLRAEGTRFVNGRGEPIRLRGAALGNWMLLEGYMWGFMDKRADRTRAIESLAAQLCGPDYARAYFPRYREAFVTEGDIAQMAREGFNSVRLPLHWRCLMEEGPGVRFIEEGFRLVDRCLSWCEAHGLYAILDLHAAPGGQTGANIDDTYDNIPRLFVDRDNWDKALALWEEIARRYAHRWIVGGYDLLNEPIRPPKDDALVQDVDFLIPALSRFYTECVARIRRVDSVHMISLEGAHWSRDTRIFDHAYDPNMCLHFHTYWTLPHEAILAPYRELSQRLQIPLWLGETGENTLEWFTTLFPLLDELDISWNFWPWKKGIRRNSPCTVPWPEGWQQVIDYLKGGPHPGFESGQALFEAWLENSRFENNVYAPEVAAAILRHGNVVVPAIAYDVGGHTAKASERRAFRPDDGLRHLYRHGTLPETDTTRRHGDGNVRLDHPWVLYDLMLAKGERAAYAYERRGKAAEASLLCRSLTEAAKLILSAGGQTQTVEIPAGPGYAWTKAFQLEPGWERVSVTVEAVEGEVALQSVRFKEA